MKKLLILTAISTAVSLSGTCLEVDSNIDQNFYTGLSTIGGSALFGYNLGYKPQLWIKNLT